jgi:hypothetical protein
MDTQARTETLIGRNHALLRRAAATWAYSALIFDATAETTLMAHVAQLSARHSLLRAQHLLLMRRRTKRRNGGPSAP